ncbi:MAG: transposase [Saprospiraceae bacterium]|nr:transposase [Saprospiraceae bacterium]
MKFKIRWVVHSTHPTMNTIVIEKYLARYINRVAISNNRLQYLKDNHKVIILYNDYKNQLSGCPAPKAFKELDPIPAIHQILEHVLPSFSKKPESMVFITIHLNALILFPMLYGESLIL